MASKDELATMVCDTCCQRENLVGGTVSGNLRPRSSLITEMQTIIVLTVMATN